MDPKAKEKPNVPVTSVGVGNKERDLRVSVEASESLPVVPSNLQSVIKAVEPSVPHEPEAGITASMESTPVTSGSTTNIQLPYTEEEAEGIISDEKHSINMTEHLGEESGKYQSESKFFLAEEVRKYWKKFKDSTKMLVKKPA